MVDEEVVGGDGGVEVIPVPIIVHCDDGFEAAVVVVVVVVVVLDDGCI